MSRMLTIGGIVLFGFASMGFAQDDGPRVVKLTVSPAPASASPMPYSLLPHLREIKSGNAAVFYQRSQSLDWWGAASRKDINKSIETLENPWNAESAKSSGLLESGALKEVDLAARCEYCDWQLLDRVRSESYMLLIPDIQSFRTIAAFNSVRIRAAIHQGEFDKAASGLQTNFAMAKHVGEAPCLIAYLVGAAMMDLGKDRVVEWVAQPDAPSLYWALTDLPQPLIDWRRPLQAEIVMMESLMPEIRQALQENKPRPIPLDVLQKRSKKFAGDMSLRLDPVQVAIGIAQTEPDARKYFAKKGLTIEEIDRLPIVQLVLMYRMAQYELRSAELMCVQNLPYWQARPMLKKLFDQIHDRNNSNSIDAIHLFLLPSYERIFPIRPRLEREFAMLRHVEALRLYAAQHQGQWPETLDDLRDWPLPVDPFTGKAFPYHRENGVAILEAFTPPGQPAESRNRIRYELTLRSK